MKFDVPVAEAKPLIEEARLLLDGPAKDLIDEHGREHGHEPSQDPDGSLAGHVREFKRSMHRLGADAGLYAPNISARLGGRGTSLRASMYLQEEIFLRGFRGQQWILAWTDGPNPMIETATDRAVAEFVEPLMRAQITTAFAQTEPEAGSDAMSMRTLARRSGGDWVIRGHKHLITNAPFAEVVQVVARTEDGRFGVFLVPGETPGLSRGPVLQTIMDDGQTGSLSFEDCRIPHDMVLGEPSKGFGLPMRWINWTKARRAGMCVGLARHCLDRALGYAKEREAFGKLIGSIEQVALQISEAYRRTWATRAACDRLLEEIDASDPWEHLDAGTRANFAVIKLAAEECLLEAADVAVQVFGGLGLLKSTGLEHIFRVARNLRIPGGTAEIQRREVARSLGLLRG
ncbi:MAG TPA: acyl-CoA dehydrogenase [Rubrobacteraceae bacterium]|jgi:alkylation response protein AidB-like acyl-CoA dehydrogenase|nr:acyl-CoA dehydrogenase [Rubrobacteraceae bacterium]